MKHVALSLTIISGRPQRENISRRMVTVASAVADVVGMISIHIL